MYAGYQGRSGDALDSFLAQGAGGQQGYYQNYSIYPQQQGYQMAAADVQSTPVYGSPGSFAGRKAMAPPGGFSSLSLGDGSNYSPYSRYGAYQSGSPAGGGILGQYGAAPGGYGGQSSYSPAGGYGGGNADLSNQLNIPNAMRRPPSAGRRAQSQPSYGAGADGYGASSYQAQSPYGGAAGGYGASAAGGYGASAAGGYGASAAGGYGGASAYGQQSSAYGGGGYGASSAAAGGGYGGASAYGGAGYGQQSSAYGGGYGGASAAGGYGGASAYGNASPYGGAAAGGGYGAAAGGGYGGGYGAASGYGGGYGGGGAAAGSPKGNYSPSSPTGASAPFHAGQKGQFGGKIITQPPGGKSSINLFG
mmetsp:Transcript_23894/g.60847  ORF Transcript_23894/g.60847 Transcript_23894/m.60847 type:complete len:363 (-) Transcript_23894:157-1245(-)|eukprot:CAMPEP_0202864194 /NCGR_PEP_ID=MMETSP1391-20130828/4537_1 /ASSEMBLY_ACC=CAM_ASM_000867 /TAXON_ID=1034604 /ORGANISM="Chlamydomonas leiostraca, Strain SAG 11-49" /LENGTH=362 /DNA_ID=CAMNT_0049543913 /DNA_START=15 /DNA_END=1103 /DNA_ORIENTATION=-